MGARSSTKITKRVVDEMPPGSTIWDSEVSGFGVRRQVDQRTYVLKCSIRRQRHFVTIGKHGSPWTVERARAEARSILYGLHKGESPILCATRASVSVEDLCKRYLSDHAPSKKPSSIRSDECLIRNHILPLLGQKTVGSTSREDIERFHRAVRNGATSPANPREVQLRQKGGRVARGGPGAANRSLTLLSKMFNLAEDWELRPQNSNPTRRIKRYPEVRRERFLTKDELFRIWNAMEAIGADCFAIAAIKLLLFTGARLGEILGLKWDWVDTERALLLLPDSKTGQKTIRLCEPALKIINSLPRYKNNPYVMIGARPGRRLVNLQSTWKMVCRSAQLAPTRLHDLRHTYASVAIEEGISLAVTGALLSHNSTKTTERYAHLQRDQVWAASEQIGARLSEIFGQSSSSRGGTSL